MQAKHVDVLIRRDMAEIVKANVYEHEVEILKDIHGDGNVGILDTEYPVVEIDADEEYDRLVMVYGANDAGQVFAERNIGRGPKQLEAVAAESVAPKRGRKKAEIEE